MGLWGESDGLLQFGNEASPKGLCAGVGPQLVVLFFSLLGLENLGGRT
jgi:hypothetical protein